MQRKVGAGPQLHTRYICKPSRVLEVFRFSNFERESELSFPFASSSGSLHWIAEITSQSIEEEGIATIRLDLERRLRIESKALFESTANYSSRWHAAELRTALEEGCAGDSSTARDRDLSSASNSSSVKSFIQTLFGSLTLEGR